MDVSRMSGRQIEEVEGALEIDTPGLSGAESVEISLEVERLISEAQAGIIKLRDTLPDHEAYLPDREGYNQALNLLSRGGRIVERISDPEILDGKAEYRIPLYNRETGKPE